MIIQCKFVPRLLQPLLADILISQCGISNKKSDGNKKEKNRIYINIYIYLFPCGVIAKKVSNFPWDTGNFVSFCRGSDWSICTISLLTYCVNASYTSLKSHRPCNILLYAFERWHVSMGTNAWLSQIRVRPSNNWTHFDC